MQTIALSRESVRDFVLVLIGSLIICLSGLISIPLWFTPIPLTIQNSVALLIGALLGPRRGAAAVFAFLAQGALGLPVFSAGGFGFAHFLGPKGGYLIGYLIGACAVGWIAERRKTMASAVGALAVGNGLIYFFGALYLSLFIGIKEAFFLGVVPFLGGDFIKALVSLKILRWAGWTRSSQ